MIAAVVRYHQTPPILEIMFLAKLLAIQNLTNSTILFSIYFDSEFNKIPTRGTTICRLGNSIVLIARGYSISLRRDAFSIYYEVSKYCYESHGYIDISHLFGPTIRADNAKGLGLAVGAFSGLLLLLFIFYFFASVRSKLWAWWLRLRRLPPGLVQRVWHRTLYARTIIRKHFYKAVAFIIMWIYSWLIISYAIRLDQIKRLAGQERDNEWGYGQTTAVLLLLPAGKAALKSGYEIWTKKKAQATASTQTEDSETMYHVHMGPFGSVQQTDTTVSTPPPHKEESAQAMPNSEPTNPPHNNGEAPASASAQAGISATGPNSD